MADFDWDEKLEKIELDQDSLDVAIERATEAEYAGMDNHTQLTRAIKGYLAHQWEMRRTK